MRFPGTLTRLCLTLLALEVAAFCQKPEISPGGIVNAASYATGYGTLAGGYSKALARGSIVSIFGRNLAASTESATSVPLPKTLAGTSVTVGGVPAPLFYVSPGQINLQFPSSTSFRWSVVVTTSTGASDPVTIDNFENFGIFTLDSSGCGRGVVLNVAVDGSVSLNSPSNSASPGDFISIYGTGLGVVDNAPPDGIPAPKDQVPSTVLGVHSVFDFKPSLGQGGRTSFAGRAPGMIGVDQVNAQIPADVREGCGVPLTVLASRTSSQTVPVSIRRGGGPCVDPPSASYGSIAWEKTVASGIDSITTAETLTAIFRAAPGQIQAPLVEYWKGVRQDDFQYHAPFCPLPGYQGLDVGTVTVQGPGFGPASASPIVVDSHSVYRAALQPGTIQPGQFEVKGSGGADVGSFETSVKIGSGINITSSFPPGTVLLSKPILISWAGGDPDTWVRATLVTYTGSFDDSFTTLPVRTSSGSITIPVVTGGHLKALPVISGPAEIIVEVIPDPSQVATLSVPGLSLGGQHTWRYTYRFNGLTIP